MEKEGKKEIFSEEVADRDIDLNSLFPDKDMDVNKLFPDIEIKRLIKGIEKDKRNIKKFVADLKESEYESEEIEES
ncbi:MAG: hypothetical protein ACC630_06680 [Nitrospinota bacterium]